MKKIFSLPELIRNEDETGFIYPEEFRNKLFEYSDFYVYFTGNTHVDFPKPLIDMVIQETVTQYLTNIEHPETITRETIEKLLDERLNNSFTNVNNVIDNLTDKFSSCIELKDLQTFREQIEKSVNQLILDVAPVKTGSQSNTSFDKIQTDLDNFTLEIGNTLNELTEKIAYVDKKIDAHISELGSRITPTPSMELIRNIVNQILSETISPWTTEEQVIALIKAHTNIDNAYNPEESTLTYSVGELNQLDSKLTLSELVVLKEAGYTIDEIKQLKEAKLL